MDDLAKKIEQLVDSEELYLEPSIRKQLRILARRLGLAPQDLKELVETAWKMPYREWIDRKRLDRAEAMLSSPKHSDIKIITLAQECGYVEINVFNHRFKERTGMTPTGYRAFHLHFRRVVGVSPDEYERDGD